MASISSSGVGSGLDVSSLVSQLVAAERAPEDKRLSTQKSSAQAELSALGTFRSALSTLQGALDGLKAGGAFSDRTATSADTSVFGASADKNAAPGEYSVEVSALASAHKLASAGFNSTDAAAVGTGTLTLQVGSASFDVAIADGSNSLAAIRDAINNAADNKGVRASLLTASDGVHLMLAATDTGSSHALSVTASGGDGKLAALTYGAGNTAHYTEVSKALDATVLIDGFSYTSGSNSIGGAIEGVTLNLAAAKPGSKIALSVGYDNASVTGALKSFIQSYNAFVAVTATVTRYDPDTKQAAALLGDSAVRGISTGLRSLLGSEISGLPGSANALADLGITTSVDGTLSLDESKLGAALASSQGDVATLVNGGSGFATQLGTLLSGYLAVDGQVAARTTGVQAELNDIADRQTALNDRMSTYEATLTAQYTALDTLISQLQSTSNFLAQNLVSLSSAKS